MARFDGARLWSIVATSIAPSRGGERGGTHRTIGISRSRARDAARGRPESDATVAAGGGKGKRRVGEEARSSRDFWRGADPSERGEGDTRGDARDWVESHLLISEQRAGRFWTSARARAPPRSGSRGPQPRASGPATGPRSTPHPGASMFASASADEPSARLGSRRRDARRATRRRCHPRVVLHPRFRVNAPGRSRGCGNLAARAGEFGREKSPLVDVARWYRRENGESFGLSGARY